MFLVECRNVPPGTPRGVDFWLLRFLLSVSDVQPDAVPHPKRPSPAPRVLSAPRPPLPSHSATRNRLACRSASVSRENQQQIIFSVLNKLLYFDTRQRGAVVFSGSRSGTWGAHARERRRTAASWGTGPDPVLRGTSPQLPFPHNYIGYLSSYLVVFLTPKLIIISLFHTVSNWLSEASYSIFLPHRLDYTGIDIQTYMFYVCYMCIFIIFLYEYIE